MQETEKKHILVVDDDPMMLSATRLLLKDTYKMSMANSGHNALELLAMKPVDLILLDYEMPHISGPKLMEMIRSDKKTKDIPVMILTALNESEIGEDIHKWNPQDILFKTMPPEELMERIDGFLNSK